MPRSRAAPLPEPTPVAWKTVPTSLSAAPMLVKMVVIATNTDAPGNMMIGDDTHGGAHTDVDTDDTPQITRMWWKQPLSRNSDAPSGNCCQTCCNIDTVVESSEKLCMKMRIGEATAPFQEVLPNLL